MDTFVFVGNKMYTTTLPTRESLFYEFREALPDEELILFESGTEKSIRAKAKEILLYSEWKNR